MTRKANTLKRLERAAMRWHKAKGQWIFVNELLPGEPAVLELARACIAHARVLRNKRRRKK